MYLLKVATQTATYYVDLAVASKALNASGSNAAVSKAKAHSEASS